MELSAAYRACREITRARARNFSYGIRLLPPPKRDALSAVYAFARRVDDIGDDEGGHGAAARLAQLDEQRAVLDGLDQAPGADDHHATDPVLVALRDAHRRFALPLEAAHDLIDGVAMDVTGTTYETIDELITYCRRVAGSIGRLSLAVFGTEDPGDAVGRADALGVALQLTNILRDVREDSALGRTYLPAEDRRRFGLETLDPTAPGFSDLIRFEAARARGWYREGLTLLPMLDRRCRACVSAMAGIYERVLRRIERQPGMVGRQRIGLPAVEKGWVAARALAGAGP